MSCSISLIKYISIKLELHTLTWRVTPNPWRRSWESKAPLMLRLSAGIATLLTSSKVINIIKSLSDSWENFKQNREIKVQMSNDEWKYTFSRRTVRGGNHTFLMCVSQVRKCMMLIWSPARVSRPMSAQYRSSRRSTLPCVMVKEWKWSWATITTTLTALCYL